MRTAALLVGIVAVLGSFLASGGAPPAVAQSAGPLSVATGGDFSCAVLATGALTCWGANDNGKFTPPAGTDYKSVIAGGNFACAQKTDNTLVCWGDDTANQVSGLPAGVAFSQYSTGADFACGIPQSGAGVTCWGDDAQGQVSGAPTSGTFISIAAAHQFACAVATGGAVQCWGSGISTTPKNLPPAQSVDAGLDLACEITTASQLRCWGISPAATAGNGLTGIQDVAAGGTNFGCALTTSGTLDCFPASSDPRVNPPALPAGTTWTGVSAGNATACGLATDGWARCWGQSSGGVPGDVGAPPAFRNASTTPIALAAGFTRMAYSQTLQVSATPAITSYTVAGGALPAGLSLNGATGQISGTPTVPGSYTFTVEASDGVFVPAVQQFSIGIAPQVAAGFQARGSHGLDVGSSPDGGRWSPAAPGQSTGQTSPTGPAMATLNGRVYEAFVANGPTPQILVSSSTDGVHWSRWAGTGQYTSGPPTMTAFDGQLWISFVSNDRSHRVLVIHSTDGVGAHWSGYLATGQTSAFTPCLAAFAPTGRPASLYLAFTAGNHDLLVMSSSDGVHWGRPVATGQTTSHGPGLGVAGSSLVAAFVTNSGPYHVWDVTSGNGTGWSGNSRTPLASERRPVVLSVTSGGVTTTYVVATNSSDGRIVVSKSTNGGKTWGIQLSTPYFSDWGPAVAPF